MKLSGRAGHNPLSTGATGIMDEVTENRKIFAASKAYLSTKHSFIDCTPGDLAGQDNDLNYGIDMANQCYADMFYSVHLNKAYNEYEGKLGAEIWLNDNNSSLLDSANRILDNLEKLGFKRRYINFSVQQGKNLAELRRTIMPAMIIECFFVEATEDVATYKKVGPDAIGFAIASGIDPTITRKESLYDVPEDFNEETYLELNPDVAEAVQNRLYGLYSGAQHYSTQGREEDREYKIIVPARFYVATEYLPEDICKDIVTKLAEEKIQSSIIKEG